MHSQLNCLHSAQLSRASRLNVLANKGLSSSTPGGSGINPVVDLGSAPLESILVVKSVSDGASGSWAELLARNRTLSTKWAAMSCAFPRG